MFLNSFPFVVQFSEQFPNAYHWSKVLVLILFSWILYHVGNWILHKWVVSLVKRTESVVDDLIIKSPIFPRLALIPPAVFLYQFAYLFSGGEEFIRRLVTALVAFLIIIALNSFLTLLSELAHKRGDIRRANVKSYTQISKIAASVIGIIIILAILIGKSPLVLLSGIGALTAVLLLIFRDTLLSFVAGMQISTYDLLRVGDWIEAPKFGADGDVIDITLHTVMVQNWDKTITVIPTYKLVEESFKNWRGMSLSGGRRIKRAVYIDMSSVKICNGLMIERFSRFQLINEYVKSRTQEIDLWNQEHQIDESELINGRRMTNLGTFRRYIEAYLRQQPFIHKEMTLMVRQLSPTPDGLPIELYCFTNDIRWVNYESIQADIFDHVLAVAPMFDLRIFQHPTGNDFKSMVKTQ